MDLQNADILGVSLLVILTLLGIYTLILRIREYSKELPDPKLTYATWTELDKLRLQLKGQERDHRKDFDYIRAEIKADHNRLDRSIKKNTERVSALIATQQLTQQRLNEVAYKTDKTIEKLKS